MHHKSLANSAASNRKVQHFMQMSDWNIFREPKMVYIGLVDKDDYNFYKAHPEQACYRKLKNPSLLINELRAKGYRVTDINSPEAADPSYMVISPTGLRTPYLAPQNAKPLTIMLIKDLIQSESIYPLSYPHPRGFDEEADIPDGKHNYTTEFSGYSHPHPKTVNKIINSYGTDFRETMIQNAYLCRRSDEKLRNFKIVHNSDNIGFSARSYGQDAYQGNRFNQDEGRMMTYASPNLSDALRFSGMKFNAHPNIKFAFVEAFAMPDNQKFTREFGLETAMDPVKSAVNGFETIICKERNTYLATLMVFENNEYFEIPEDNPKWQDFKELYREDYQAYNQYIFERRKACSDQICNLHGLKVYDLFGKDEQIYPENDITHNKLKSKSEDLAENLSNIRDKAMQTGAITPLSELMPQEEIQTINAKINKKTHERLSAGLARILQMIIDSKQQKTNKVNITQQPVKNKDNLR